MNVMFDFETMGTRPDTVVLSLGAAVFNRDGIIETKGWNFNRFYQEEMGRTVSADTLAWWQKQSGDAQAVFRKAGHEAMKLEDFCTDLHDWILEVGRRTGDKDFSSVKPWGNGADFDISILTDIYQQFGVEQNFQSPFKFWNHRCFRTLNALTDIKRKYQHKGVLHDAVDDAIYQAECAIKVLWPKKKK